MSRSAASSPSLAHGSIASGIKEEQPETKVYKAVGQLVAGLLHDWPPGFDVKYGIAVFGPDVAAHLQRCSRLSALGVFGIEFALEKEAGGLLFAPSGFDLHT